MLGRAQKHERKNFAALKGVTMLSLRPSPIAAALLSVSLGMIASPGLAQQASDTERLLKVIEEQQRRLEAQERQLQEQKDALQVLRKQVEAVQDAQSAAPSATVAAAPGPEAPKLEKAVAPREDWPGSVGLLGSETRIAINGFIELDAIHDSDAIVTPSAFVTQGILTRGATAAEGADGQTNFSAQASRVGVETRTPIGDRRLRTFTSVDWFDDFSTTKPNIRLREAYAELSDALFGGDLLVGQTWSTYTNLYATPNVLDFQAPNALFGTRHPMVRWTKPVSRDLRLIVAAEAPDLRSFEGADDASRWPDGVLALTWQTDTLNLQGSFLARDLRASDGTASGTVDDFGWGASLQGRIGMPASIAQDFASFSLTYGEGFGGVLNDIPPDAAYDTLTGKLEAIQTLAWFVGYQHWWHPGLYSVVSYGLIDQDNLAFQGPTAYHKTQYATANLTWTPLPQWLFGIELMYGSREDNDGAKGEVYRTQITSRFTF